MVDKIISYLPPRKSKSSDQGDDGTLRIVDLTCGGGGHSEAILRHYSDDGAGFDDGGRGDMGRVVVYGVDQDEESMMQTGVRLGEWGKVGGRVGVEFKSIYSNFASLSLEDFGDVKVDFVMGDFGVSSHQIDDEGRGFSYSMLEGPLDMRMDKGGGLTAADSCNGWEEVRGGGEEGGAE